MLGAASTIYQNWTDKIDVYTMLAFDVYTMLATVNVPHALHKSDIGAVAVRIRNSKKTSGRKKIYCQLHGNVCTQPLIAGLNFIMPGFLILHVMESVSLLESTLI
jgi:4-hydroxy-3-methylbut-2-en-1-yl diphosphate synthase IspG/GcpE